jgi:hypothetical protein
MLSNKTAPKKLKTKRVLIVILPPSFLSSVKSVHRISIRASDIAMQATGTGWHQYRFGIGPDVTAWSWNGPVTSIRMKALCFGLSI